MPCRIAKSRLARAESVGVFCLFWSQYSTGSSEQTTCKSVPHSISARRRSCDRTKARSSSGNRAGGVSPHLAGMRHWIALSVSTVPGVCLSHLLIPLFDRRKTIPRKDWKLIGFVVFWGNHSRASSLSHICDHSAGVFALRQCS